MKRSREFLDRLKSLSDQMQFKKINTLSKNAFSPRSVESKSYLLDQQQRKNINFDINQPERNAIHNREKYKRSPKINKNYEFQQANYRRRNPLYYPHYQKIVLKNQNISKRKNSSHSYQSDSLRSSKIYTSNLIKSQSLSHIYRKSRIQTLGHISNLLEDRKSTKSLRISQDQNISKKPNKQINQRIDRLQKYLYKIKRQRKSEVEPVKVVQNYSQNNRNNRIVSSNAQLEEDSKQDRNDHFNKAFEELQRIRKQLIEIRATSQNKSSLNGHTQALTNNRNGLNQKSKKQSSNLQQSNTLIAKSSNTLNTHTTNSIQSHNIQPNYSPIKMIYQPNYNTRGNQQMGYSTNNLNAYNFSNRKDYVSSKPKITFSFNSKY